MQTALKEKQDSTRMPSSLQAEIASVTVALVLCFLILWFPMGLRRSQLHVPISYFGGDDLAYSVFMKGVVDGGWFLHNDMLGAPFGTDVHDFPVNDSISLLLVKFFTLFTRDFALIFNLFLIVNYPITVLVTYGVFRQFKLRYAASVVGSLFYAFIPYHYSRAIGHIFYSVYFAVPLMVMVLVWLMNGTLRGSDLLTLEGIKRNKGKVSICAVSCILISSTGGFYYSFFALFFLGIAGLFLLIRERHWQSLIAPSVIAAGILLVLTLNVIPNLVYYAKNGRTSAVVRTAAEAEYGGLKISSLLLPLPHHVLESFAAVRIRSLKSPLTTENQDSTLGIFGSLGFLFLLGFLLFRKSEPAGEESPDTLFRNLGILNISGVLFATIGGFGSLFALLIWPQIRSYNRISVYLAFFSFLTFFLLIDRVLVPMVPVFGKPSVYFPGIALLFILGTADLLGHFNLVNNGELAAAYKSDHDFVKRIEARLPAGSMVFQLPYAAFPESRGQVQMQDYDHLRGYFSSSHLKWSFGAMKGRMPDLWQQSVSSRPVPQMLDALAKSGFAGIYLDRYGYEDQGKQLEEALSRIVGPASLTSANGRLLFFDLTGFQRQLQASFSPGEWERAKSDALHPTLISWLDGFYGLETDKEGSWRWGRSTSYASIVNGSNSPREMVFEAAIAALAKGELEIRSDLWQDKITISSKPSLYSRTITVPPGNHLIEFHSGIVPPPVPNDDRTLIFRINNAILRAAGQSTSIPEPVKSAEVKWENGFYPEETLGSDRWRWAQSEAALRIAGPTDQPHRFRLEMSIASLTSGTLTIRSASWNESLRLSDKPLQYSKQITLGPGEQVISFKCDAPFKPVPNDDRKLVFRINNFSIKSED